MIQRFYVAPAAEADMDQSWHFIARDNPDAADRWLEQILERVEMLCRQPMLGESCEDLQRGLRQFPVGQYVIFYRVEGQELVVSRVIHGARDYARLFSNN